MGKNLDSSKLNEFTDDISKFDKKKGRWISKWVENNVGKKEKLLLTNNFSFSPTVFSKDLNYRHVKTMVCLGKG